MAAVLWLTLVLTLVSWRIAAEDRLLRHRFGAGAAGYQRRVPALGVSWPFARRESSR